MGNVKMQKQFQPII